jgi:hypothetical protein
MAARSKACVCSRSLAGIRIPPEAQISVPCECCVLSGRGLCVGLITRPEESYRVWCVLVWSWSLNNEDALAHWGLLRHWKKKAWKLQSSGICRERFEAMFHLNLQVYPDNGRRLRRKFGANNSNNNNNKQKCKLIIRNKVVKGKNLVQKL